MEYILTGLVGTVIVLAAIVLIYLYAKAAYWLMEKLDLWGILIALTPILFGFITLFAWAVDSRGGGL